MGMVVVACFASSAPGVDGLADALDLVGGKVVHDDDIAAAQRRRQGLLDPGKESFAVDRAVEHAGRADPIVAQRGEQLLHVQRRRR